MRLLWSHHRWGPLSGATGTVSRSTRALMQLYQKWVTSCECVWGLWRNPLCSQESVKQSPALPPPFPPPLGLAVWSPQGSVAVSSSQGLWQEPRWTDRNRWPLCVSSLGIWSHVRTRRGWWGAGCPPGVTYPLGHCRSRDLDWSPHSQPSVRKTHVEAGCPLRGTSQIRGWQSGETWQPPSSICVCVLEYSQETCDRFRWTVKGNSILSWGIANYHVVRVSGGQWRDSAIHARVSILPASTSSSHFVEEKT